MAARPSSSTIQRKRNRLLFELGPFCHLCGNLVLRSQLTLDHVVALTLGGSNDRSNLGLAHRACNEAKARAERLVRQWRRWRAYPLAMALTAFQLATIREAIGQASPPTDDDLATTAAALGIATEDDSLIPVIRSVLRDRLATLLSSPTSVTIPGFYSESNADGARLVAEQLDNVEAGGKEMVVAGRLIRANRSRTFGIPTRL